MIHFLVGLTLLIGTIISFKSKELILYYGAYYGMCLLALKSMKYGKEFFKSFNYNNTLQDKKVLVAGESVSTNLEKDSQEDRFLNIFATDRLVKRRVFTWLLFFAGLWFFQYRLGIEFSLETIVPLLTCIVIVNTFFVGHFLISLLLNLFVVLYGYTGEVHASFYLIYATLFLGCLYVIGAAREKISAKKAGSLILLGTLLLSLCWSFFKILPDQATTEVKTSLEDYKVQDLKDKLGEMKIDLGKMKLKIPERNIAAVLEKIKHLEGALNESHSSSDRAQLTKQLDNIVSDFGKLKAQFSGSVELDGNLKGFSAEELNTLSQYKNRMQRAGSLDSASEDLQKLGQSLEQVKMNLTAENLSAEDFSKLEKEAAKLGEDINLLKNPEALAQNEQETFKKMLDKLPEERKGDLNASVSKGKLTVSEKDDLIRVMENFHKESTETPKEELTFSSGDEEKLLEILREDKEKSQDQFSLLKRLIPFIVAIFIILVVTYLLRKKGIKKVIGRDPRIVEELREEWKDLKKLKLSPREEVIHYYNLFHESVQKIHYETHEAPPSCIILEDMKEFQPVLEKSTHVLTEVFAQCYYGDKNVTPQTLKTFRKAISNILKVYQLN